MASSNGRDRLSSRGQRTFAFGSSTPRDLSHLNKVLPAKLRSYDAKSTEKSEGPSLRDYIIRARSLSREASTDNRNSFVFGSSTPRSFAHLDKIPTKQRIYDAKIPKKSATHSDFKATPIRYNFVPPKTAVAPKKDISRHVITSKDDDIASEPDIVQDREEFMEEMRKHKKKLEDSKKKVKLVEANEEQKFGHAPEIEGNAQKTIRAQTKTHEAAPVAVENRSANKMNDQIEVSQLNGEEEEEIEPVAQIGTKVSDIMSKVAPVDEIKKTTEKIGSEIEIAKNQISKTAESTEKKIAKVAENVNSEIENVKNTLSSAAEKVGSEVENVKNSISKSAENNIASVKTAVSDAGKAVESEIENMTNTITKTVGDIGAEVKDVKNEIAKTAGTINNEIQDAVTKTVGSVESEIDSLKNVISDSTEKV